MPNGRGQSRTWLDPSSKTHNPQCLSRSLDRYRSEGVNQVNFEVFDAVLYPAEGHDRGSNPRVPIVDVGNLLNRLDLDLIDTILYPTEGDDRGDDRGCDRRAPYIVQPVERSGLYNDKRWQYGVPPQGNANFAWAHHLAPNGIAGFVLANGSMSSNQSGEGAIRKNLIEAGLVDCMVALPGQLFYSTQIPACLWFLAQDRMGVRHRDR